MIPSHEDMENPTNHAIRPCRLMLRGFALWQPNNASLLMKYYNKFGYVMLVALVTAIIYLFSDGVHWERSVNGVMFSALFVVAFLCTKWHYRKGNYRMMEVEHGPELEDCCQLVKRYNIFALVLWVVCSGQLLWFFYYSFRYKHSWNWFLYVYLAVIGNGWRICWLILYAYICHVHWRQIQSIYERYEIYQSEPIGPDRVEDLMSCFHQMKKKLNGSEKALHGIISLSVAIHVVDMTAYSFAFFSGDFEKDAEHNHTSLLPLVDYLLEMFLTHFISLFIKLVPAAIVNSSLRKLVILVGDMCTPLKGLRRDQMMLYQQHVHISEQDMGYRILGVKITARLTGYLFTTLVSVFIAVIHFTNTTNLI